MIYRGRPCLTFFSSVVKNVANANVEVKKLVYIYLLHYAESEPDLALLSINTIQKSLSDQSPKVRAMALRTMSGIKVPVISQIVSLAIKKGCGDLSPIVRKAAALAIPKCYRLDPNTLPQLVEYISALLGDRQYFVAGAAVVAMKEVCPDRIELLHNHYRALIKKLVDMDEWSQLATLHLLSHYARRCFPLRFHKIRQDKSKGFYESDGGGSDDDGSLQDARLIAPDLELLLRTCKTLLYSRNSAVIVSVARCFLDLGTDEHVKPVIGPLIALLRSAQDIREVILRNIMRLCQQHPRLVAEYASHFLVQANESPALSRLKLEIIAMIFRYCEAHIKGLLLSELSYLSQSSVHQLIQEAVRTIGRCAQSDPSTTDHCMTVLLSRVSSPEGSVAAEALSVLRHLIQQNPPAHRNTIVRLAKNLDTATDPRARATVIWLVGEYASGPETSEIAPDVLRLVINGFSNESEFTKLQILVLAAKVYLRHLVQNQSSPSLASNGRPLITEQEDSLHSCVEKHSIEKLWTHILLQVRYDTSFDLRDRMRTYRSLLASPQSTQLASLFLLAEKPLPAVEMSYENLRTQPIGSASLVLGPETRLSQDSRMPNWVKEGDEPDSSLRNSEFSIASFEAKPTTASAQLAKSAASVSGTTVEIRTRTAKAKTLDDWLDEEGSSGEDEETEEGSGEDESEDEEESDPGQDQGEKRRLTS